MGHQAVLLDQIVPLAMYAPGPQRELHRLPNFTAQASWLCRTRSYTQHPGGLLPWFLARADRSVGWILCLAGFTTRLPGGVGLEAMLSSWAGLQICFPTLAVE